MTVYPMLLFICLRIAGSSSCRAHVCLTWKIKHGNLMLTCKTDTLYYIVSFYHPLEKERAFCTLTTCHSTITNSFITQNTTTKETFLTIPIDKKFNGLWLCKYGETNGKADVEVTLVSHLFSTGFGLTKKKSKNKTGIKSTVLWAIFGFAAGYFLSRFCICLLTISCCNTAEENISNKIKKYVLLKMKCRCFNNNHCVYVLKNTVVVFILVVILIVSSSVSAEVECIGSPPCIFLVVCAAIFGVICSLLLQNKDAYSPVSTAELT